MRVKCPARHTTQCPWPELGPGPLAPESRALTTRPPHLQYNKNQVYINQNTFFNGSRLETDIMFL